VILPSQPLIFARRLTRPAKKKVLGCGGEISRLLAIL
jgi:hypothetical protein